MPPATASRSSAPIKFLYPRRKRIRTLCQSETYAHSQSDVRKSRDHKARSSLYGTKEFSLSGLRALRAGAIFSLILRAILYMFPFRPKRGLVSAKNLPYKENIFLPAAHQQHMPCRRGKFLLCSCNQGPLCFSSGKIGNRLRHHWSNDYPAQGFPESEGDSAGERLALWPSIRTSGGDFLARPRLWG
jgi:hypothetical protein